VVLLKAKEVETLGGQTPGHTKKGSQHWSTVSTEGSFLRLERVPFIPHCQGLVENDMLLPLLEIKRHTIMPSWSTSQIIGNRTSWGFH
jgi:hypothetical protein